MTVKQISIAAVAALGLSIGAYSAEAGPANETGITAIQQPGSSFTLVAQGQGQPDHGGGAGMQPGGGGGKGGGQGGGGAMTHPGGQGSAGGGGAMHHQGGGGRSMMGGRAEGGRHAGYERGGRHGYWRGGRYIVGGPVIYRGGCFSRCLSRGFGPGYCRANAFRVCY